MFVKIVIPLMTTLLILIVVINSLNSTLWLKLHQVHELRNYYLLTINLYSKINSTLDKVLDHEICRALKSEYSDCKVIAKNIAIMISNELLKVSRRVAKYNYSINYAVKTFKIFWKDNKTILKMYLTSRLGNHSINSTLIGSSSIDVCELLRVRLRVVNLLSRHLEHIEVSISSNDTSITYKVREIIYTKIRNVIKSINTKLKLNVKLLKGIFQLVEVNNQSLLYEGYLMLRITLRQVNIHKSLCRPEITKILKLSSRVKVELSSKLDKIPKMIKIV